MVLLFVLVAVIFIIAFWFVRTPDEVDEVIVIDEDPEVIYVTNPDDADVIIVERHEDQK